MRNYQAKRMRMPSARQKELDQAKGEMSNRFSSLFIWILSLVISPRYLSYDFANNSLSIWSVVHFPIPVDFLRPHRPIHFTALPQDGVQCGSSWLPPLLKSQYIVIPSPCRDSQRLSFSCTYH